MKRIFPMILTVFIFTACNSNIKKITKLEQELKKVHSKQEEKRILTELWTIAYNSEDVNMSVSAIDSLGNNVITNLQKAVEPVKVTVTMSMKDWIKKIEFVPLDIKNVYLLLRE